jgi:hypothetical protein
MEVADFDFVADKAVTNFTNTLGQWFSTFLSLRHTNFDRKFGGTLKRKKGPKR